MNKRGILLPQLPSHDDTDSMGYPMWDHFSMLAYARKCVAVDRKLAKAEVVSGSDAEAIKVKLR